MGALCLAMLATTGCGALFVSDQEKVSIAIRAFYTSVATTNIDNIVQNSCSSLGAKLRTYFDTLGPQDNDRKKLLSLTVDSISDIQVVGDTATASVTGHSSSKPDPATIVATVVKENGEWKYCTQ
ncbi:Rv0361 family membrane protein [Fodinicola feengrottensis]|uniref:DUF4878 domain-containing protein n=2 Tax=Fodinicola feengrottensis TaxID=435914 RepID=A0ABN2HGB0_9ACTN